jgi:hypothetical protein
MILLLTKSDVLFLTLTKTAHLLLRLTKVKTANLWAARVMVSSYQEAKLGFNITLALIDPSSAGIICPLISRLLT